MPLASKTSASAGTSVEDAGPTAVILPPDMITKPFSITPCVTIRSLPPTIAIVLAGASDAPLGTGKAACAKTEACAAARIRPDARIAVFIRRLLLRLHRQSPQRRASRHESAEFQSRAPSYRRRGLHQ